MRPDDFHEEMTRLKKDNEELQIALKTVVTTCGEEIKNLRAENKQLKDNLETVEGAYHSVVWEETK